MQRAVMGILAGIIVFLVAANLRLAARERNLEEMLATAQAKARKTLPERFLTASGLPTPVDVGVARAVQPPVPVARESSPWPNSAPPVVPTAAAPVLPKPVAPVTLTLMADRVIGGSKDGLRSIAAWTVLTPGNGDEGLGLSESQQNAIDELRKNRDAQAQTYRNAMAALEDQTDQAIRHLLDPQQLEKYDTHGTSAVIQLAAQIPEDPTPAGPRPGFLEFPARTRMEEG